MTREEALAECEATVRRFDPDRYFASLFAPVRPRKLLYALYAFNYEIARVAEATREPVMGEIRLQWWREAVEAARAGDPPAHPVAIGLGELFASASPPLEWFDEIVDAHAPVGGPDPFAELSDLDSFAESTSAALMRIAGFLLDPDTQPPELIREAGIAYGLTVVIRSVHFLAARRKLSERDPAEARDAIAKISGAARGHLARARQLEFPKRSLAAVLPASLVPAWLARAAVARDPLHERLEILPLRRQLVLLRAALVGRL